MKLFFIMLLSLSFHLQSSGQPLGAINSYLKNPAIPMVAKLYYAGEFAAHDNDSTSGILDSLNTRNAATRPFYLLLISKMIRVSDVALSEALFPECVDFFEKRPNELIEFLYSKDQKDSLRLNWAYAIAQGLDLNDEIDKQHLKASVSSKCNLKNKDNIKVFWGKINAQIH